MTVRQFAWSSMLGLAMLGGKGVAAEPARLPGHLPAAVSTNQQVADTVASRLRESGLLRDYRVDIAATDGKVELTGEVASQPQREEVLRLAQGVPGVLRVIDGLSLKEAPAIKRVRDEAPRLPVPTPDAPAVIAPPAPGAGGMIPEPSAIFRAPAPAYSALNPPNMPPYAWPTYAPYNNFSRVAYPTAYPYQSWPFLGPVYPFPKVPLGW
ncbi:MAG: BON domain-containing protein, partial [Gemmataceae bacterium]